MIHRELSFYKDDELIYGELFQPDPADALLICCHGLNGSYDGSLDIGEYLADRKIATYIFDFRGGSDHSRSQGATTKMSVLTEAQDLSFIIDELHKLPCFKDLPVFLLGKSQGSYVSTLILAQRPKQIAGFIGWYPGYILQDKAIEEAAKYESIPAELEVLKLKVGSIYLEDLLKTDIYAQMKKYPKKVLLLHGSADQIVTYGSVTKAKDCFPDAELQVIENAEHGFHGPERKEVLELSYRYLKEIIYGL